MRVSAEEMDYEHKGKNILARDDKDICLFFFKAFLTVSVSPFQTGRPYCTSTAKLLPCMASNISL